MKVGYEEDSTRESRIVHQQGQGLYYVTARESWYPSFGAFDDRTIFSLGFRSPKKYVFVATGHRTRAEKHGDFLETEWESELPYQVVGFNYGDFVDKSQSDSTLTVTAYSGREIPDVLKQLEAAIDLGDLSRRQSGQSRGGSIEAETGILRGGFNTASNAADAARKSYQAFKLFETYFGPLPFKSISVTEQPVMGYAQSWPTLIFLPFDSLLDATTRNSLRLQSTGEAREFYNVVAVHEMAHQWWGHMVGWKTYHDQWLSEGFADFSAALYLKVFEPSKFKSFWDLKRRWLLNNNRAGHRPVDVGPLWLNYQTNAYLEPANSIALIYYKGAYVLEMLRVLMEDSRSQNPDAHFVALMRDFISSYAGRNPSTDDFRKVVEKHLRQPMDWFFNEWVYGTEIPHYDFSYQLKPGEGGKTILETSLTQSGVSDKFFMVVPVYVFVGGNSHRLGLLSVKGSTTFKGSVTLPFRPEKVTLDEFHSILCTMKQ
jgi:peptidase M1-like protein